MPTDIDFGIIPHWKQLPAGRYLDITIGCRREGYTAFEISSASDLVWGTRPARDDDNPIHIVEGMISEPISQYSTDLAAAFYLLDGIVVWHITKSGKGTLIIDLWDNKASISYTAEPSEPLELAICRAWLTYMEKKDARS